MPDQVDNSQRHPRRSRKNHKASGTSSSHPPSSQHLPPTIPDAEMSIVHATQESQPCNPVVAYGASEHLRSEQSAPSTPPRSHSAQPSAAKSGPTNGGAIHSGTKKKDGTKPPDAKQEAPPRSSRSSTPSTAVRSNGLTPGGVRETPSKAYAGPTFHASPAASSLPMPKFFSKSVPNVDKSTSLKNMMESNAPDTPSENEESPSIKHLTLESDRHDREESPLDIFFQADRKGKIHANSTSQFNGTPRGLNPFESLRPDISPSRGAPRHHSRHPTDSSTGGIFKLEMDNPAPKDNNSLYTKTPPPSYDRSISAPSGGLTAEQAKEEQRQANTLALKRMLLLPETQLSEASDGSKSTEMSLVSPSPKAHQQGVSPTRVASRPASSPGLASDASRVHRQAALRALAEKQIPTSNSYTNQRAPASSLRKKSTVPSSPERYSSLELPNTPTPANVRGLSPSANTRSQTKIRASRLDSGNIPTQSLQDLSLDPKHPREVALSGPSPTTAAIENDLRRILKMDVIGSDGASGVRS